MPARGKRHHAAAPAAHAAAPPPVPTAIPPAAPATTAVENALVASPASPDVAPPVTLAASLPLTAQVPTAADAQPHGAHNVHQLSTLLKKKMDAILSNLSNVTHTLQALEAGTKKRTAFMHGIFDAAATGAADASQAQSGTTTPQSNAAPSTSVEATPFSGDDSVDEDAPNAFSSAVHRLLNGSLKAVDTSAISASSHDGVNVSAASTSSSSGAPAEHGTMTRRRSALHNSASTHELNHHVSFVGALPSFHAAVLADVAQAEQQLDTGAEAGAAQGQDTALAADKTRPQRFPAVLALLMSPAVSGIHFERSLLEAACAELGWDAATLTAIVVHAANTRSLSPHSVRTHTPPPTSFHMQSEPSALGTAALLAAGVDSDDDSEESDTGLAAVHFVTQGDDEGASEDRTIAEVMAHKSIKRDASRTDDDTAQVVESVNELNFSTSAPAAQSDTTLSGAATVSKPVPSQLPVKFSFVRFTEDAPDTYEDDGASDDIPFDVRQTTLLEFKEAEAEGMELKKLKAQMAEMVSAREAERERERRTAVGVAASTQSAAGATSAGAESPRDAYTIYDTTPPPSVKPWSGGDMPWPACVDEESLAEMNVDESPEDDGDDAGATVLTGSAGALSASPDATEADATADSTVTSPTTSRAALRAARRAAATLPRFEAFGLRVVYECGRTGFEESNSFSAPIGSVIAGRFKVRDFLGSAAFSSALACTDLSTGTDVCLKVVKNNKDYVDQSLDEIKLLRYINAQGDPDEHHVLRLHDYFYHKEHLFLVTELLKDNLYEFQKYLMETGQPPYFTPARVQRVTRQVLTALAFIHTNGLIHCDLKPENILIRSYSRCDVKVIDFGSSCYVSDRLSTYIQSRSYRAPEVILGLPYSCKIDIWSLGCILCELLTGRVLFVNDSIQTMLVRMQGLLGQFPRHMLDKGRDASQYFTTKDVVYEHDPSGTSVMLLTPKKTSLRIRLNETEDTDMLEFIASLLAVDPDKRPTAAQALQHPWMSKEYDLEPYAMPQ